MNVGRRRLGYAGAALAACGFFAVLAWSGVTAFQRHNTPVPLAATGEPISRPTLGLRPAPQFDAIAPASVGYEEVGAASGPETQGLITPAAPAGGTAGVKLDRDGRPITVNGRPWTGEVFDHRPIRPVKTQTMKTTAYSPDHRSCGKWADGITASGKSVWMNGGRLVAADRKVPYGTILTIPGYNHGRPVQVWDRGGKIKGNRLDVLYPTHEIAMRWGVQDLQVVFWEFVEAD